MASRLQRARPRLERQLPWLPASVWDRLAVSREHAAVAIGLMRCMVAAAAADGARTDGRSPWGMLYLDGQQRLIGVLALGITGGQITSISSIVNPDKLTHLGPVADFRSLLRV